MAKGAKLKVDADLARAIALGSRGQTAILPSYRHARDVLLHEAPATSESAPPSTAGGEPLLKLPSGDESPPQEALPPAQQEQDPARQTVPDSQPHEAVPPAETMFTDAPVGHFDPAGDVADTLRQKLSPDRSATIIIYGDVHMPAIQHVQSAVDKSQPPFVRGGREHETGP